MSGCSARLVRTLVGGSAPSASASPSAAPPSTPVPPSPRIEDGETAFTQALVTIIYEYLSVGKPQAITNWLAALQVSERRPRPLLRPREDGKLVTRSFIHSTRSFIHKGKLRWSYRFPSEWLVFFGKV